MQIPHIIGDTKIDADLSALRTTLNSHTHSWPNMTQMPVFDIRKFGAIGDGHHDDSVAIQKAFEEAGDAGGGRVLVPTGLFISDGIYINYGHIDLAGNGWHSTIKLRDGANHNLITIHNNWGWASIGDLILDGNKAKNSAGNGIYFDGNSDAGVIRDLIIQNCKESGVNVPYNKSVNSWEFHQVRVKQSDLSGFYIDGGWDFKFFGCVPINNARHGFHITVNGSTQNQFIGCRPNANGIIDNSSYYNLYQEASGSLWIGCLLDNSRWHGAVVNGNSNIFVGCRFSGGFENTGGSPSGLVINGDDNLVLSNTSRWNDGYGIEFGSGASSNIIALNNLKSNTLGATNATAAIRAANTLLRNKADGEPEQTFGTAAPASGTWARGSICWNTTPSASGTPGWVCTSAGTPGTWKAMAILAA